MGTTLKSPGSPCPKCDGLFCAEYAQLNEVPRWTCHECGASGELTGALSIGGTFPEKQQRPAKPVRPHWSHRKAP